MLCVHAGVLELFAVSQGVIGIKGVYSNRFLAMNKRGRLHATVSTHTHLTHTDSDSQNPLGRLSVSLDEWRWRTRSKLSNLCPVWTHHTLWLLRLLCFS